MCYIHAMEYYSTLRKKESLPYVKIMDGKYIKWNKKSQKEKYCVI